MESIIVICIISSIPDIVTELFDQMEQIILYTANLNFRDQNATHEVSEMLPIGTQVDNTTAFDLSLLMAFPIRYDIKAGNDNNTFSINKTTGVITLAKNLDRENQEVFRLIKTAYMGNGSAISVTITIVVLDVNDNPPVCPQQVIGEVREIAPIGEVVVSLECKDEDKAPNSKSSYKIVVPTKVPDNFPFVVSEFGNVVVSKPFVYRKGAGNLINFIVEVKNKKPLQNSNASDKSIVNVSITVKQTGCSIPWDYQISPSSHLNNPIFVLKHESLWSVDRCEMKCSALTECKSFDFDQSSKQCLLTTETLFTQPTAFSKKPGHTVYRKICDTEPLPAPSLRNLDRQVRPEVVQVNTSLGVDRAISIALKLHQFLDPGGDKTSADVWVAAAVLFSLMSNTVTNSNEQSYVLNLIEIINECISKLLEPYHKNLWKAGIKFGRQPIALIDTLEFMTKITSKLINTDFFVSANHSALFSYNNTYDFVDITLLGNGVSSVFIPDQNRNAGSLTSRLAVGVLEGLDTLIIPDIPFNSSGIYGRGKNLNGHILSVNTFPHVNSTFNPPILLDIESKLKNGDETARNCVFLQRGSRNVWKTDGCRLVSFNTTHTRCECNHLTNFAILMQVQDFNTTAAIKNSLETLTLIGCSASIASLMVTISTLIFLKLNSDRYILLMNLSVSLILAQVTFLAGIHATTFHSVCRLVAVLLHYFYLSVFTLMLAEGIQLYNKISRPLARDINFVMYLGLGWGAPVVIVGTCLATDLDGYGTTAFCWLSSIRGTIWAFVGPALTVITINTVILVMVIRTLLGVRAIAKRSEREKYKSSAKAAAVLLPLLGVTWTFGVLAVNANTVIFQYIFALLNSAQGVFILLFHVVLNDDIKMAIRRRRKRRVTNIITSSHTDITTMNPGNRGNQNQIETKPGTTSSL